MARAITAYLDSQVGAKGYCPLCCLLVSWILIVVSGPCIRLHDLERMHIIRVQMATGKQHVQSQSYGVAHNPFNRPCCIIVVQKVEVSVYIQELSFLHFVHQSACPGYYEYIVGCT